MNIMHGHSYAAAPVKGAGVGLLDTATSSAVSSGTDLASPSASSGRFYGREWLYRLVMFPSYFTPCHKCCVGNKTPKREQLLTLYDTQAPGNIYCSHCPEFKLRGHWLLQVRRSAFKDVVKATDILRFGCDISGIQQYTLNGSKVLYLNREAAPDRKAQPTTAVAPATCVVDGRAMMDKNSQYCSLKCKMHGEDPEFTSWLNEQDPSVKAAAYAAATAPPRPTVACKRAAPNGSPYSYGAGSSGAMTTPSPASSGGSAGAATGGFGAIGDTGARSRKAPRTAASEAAGPGGAAKVPRPSGSAAAANGAPRGAAAPRPSPLSLPSGAGGAASGYPGLTLPASPAERQAASDAHRSAFLAAATDGPVLGGEWMGGGPLADLDHALSCTSEWGSLHAAAAHDDWAAAAATAPAAGAADDWWLGNPGDVCAAPIAASACPVTLGDDDGDHQGLLVEWPAGASHPLGPPGGELLHYCPGAASPGSDADGVFAWP